MKREKEMTTQVKQDITKVDLTGLNTSQKIRLLHSQGFSRGDISRFLEKRYQHVRNVLVTPIKGN